MINKIGKFLILIFFSTFCYSCSSNQSKLEGKWNAQWRTDDSSNENFKGMALQMNGEFIFRGDKLTILAKGYPNCIFNTDTIQNIQSFKLNKESNSLTLINKNDEESLTYQIERFQKDTIKLSIMKDIIITLVRDKK